MKKRALITGITGQDGSYLAELLLAKDYEVIGMVRRTSTVNFERIAHIQDRITFAPGDLLDEASLIQVLREHRPEEVYNLAAQSFVQTSFSQPVLTGETTALGVTRLLDALRIVDPDVRFYQASSSEMFGKVVEVPQRETTPLYPRSPYGVAKVYGHWITINYRESYGLHASSGMLFNHESPRRGLEFVTRKISHGVAQIKLGRETGCTSGTSRPSGTGGSRATTSRPCGPCSSRTTPTTTWWPPVRPTRCASSARSPSATPASTTTTTSWWTRASCDPLRSTCSWATRARRRRSSIGSPR